MILTLIYTYCEKGCDMARKKGTTDAVDILHKLYVQDDPGRKAALEAERVNADVAQMIYDLRTDAGLTQKQLAELIETTQSVVSRLEDADYEGHSLSMLRRIAKALDKKLTVLMTARDPKGRSACAAVEVKREGGRKG